MSEVSGRVLGLYRSAEQKLGLRAGALFEGLAIPTTAAPERIGWATFCSLNRRLADAAGSNEALADLGATLFDVPDLLRLVRIIQLTSGPAALYWASTRWGGPLMFPTLTDTFAEDKAQGVVLIATEIPAHLEDCPAFFHLNVGFYRALPRVLRLADAHVELQITPRRGSYRIVPPPSLSVASRVRHATQALFSTRSALQELATLNGSLQRQYIEAERARQDAERQRAEAELARDAAIRAQADADKARLVAEDALRVKSEFLATISHELRTPLNGVLGMTSILLDTPLDADQIECAETIRLSGETLLRLISDVLDFARIDAGRLAVNAASFDLSALVEEILQVTSSRAHDKGLELTSSFPETVPRVVVGDAERIRQVLLNLVGNAVKFTDKGHVHLAVRSTAAADDRAKLTISVEDSGIGIARSACDRIFEAFTQADGSMTRRYGGSGLGLTISRRLVELMGGHLRLESEVGRGSTFAIELELPAEGAPLSVAQATGRVLAAVPSARTVTMIRERLPNARVEHEPDPAAATARIQAATCADDPFGLVLIDFDADEQIAAEVARAIHERAASLRPHVALLAPITRHKEAARVLFVDRVLTKPVRRAELTAAATSAAQTARRPEPRSNVGSNPNLGRGRVLVVDDNRINQLVVARMVGALGYEAAVVSDGVEAIAGLQTERFDAVLMDWHMPELDGLAATRRIKGMGGAAATTPIIALTASAFPQDREACLAAGMSDYLAKPVEMRALSEALARWIPEREALTSATG